MRCLDRENNESSDGRVRIARSLSLFAGKVRRLDSQVRPHRSWVLQGGGSTNVHGDRVLGK